MADELVHCVEKRWVIPNTLHELKNRLFIQPSHEIFEDNSKTLFLLIVIDCFCNISIFCNHLGIYVFIAALLIWNQIYHSNSL